MPPIKLFLVCSARPAAADESDAVLGDGDSEFMIGAAANRSFLDVEPDRLTTETGLKERVSGNKR